MNYVPLLLADDIVVHCRMLFANVLLIALYLQYYYEY